MTFESPNRFKCGAYVTDQSSKSIFVFKSVVKQGDHSVAESKFGIE